ncbi:MAG: starch-binding protein [Anaeroplasmataceae bacterium]|nr:starch-binding protein [Anaeroplasmataceae bacterium]
MKKILKTLAFVLVGVFAVTALVACGSKHEHKYTYESDNTKHKAICECGEENPYEPHTWGEWTVTKEATENEKGSRKHTCTVCGKEVSEDIKQLDPELAVNTAALAVYAQVPADWETVNIYYWNSLSGDANTLDPGYAVGWPGVPMTLVDEAKHLWGYELPIGVENVIFNDGSTQTVDIKLAKAKNLYVLGAEANGEGKFEITYDSYTKKDTDPELAKPVLKEAGFVVTYVTVLEDWENVNVYWYGSAKGCEWPGVAMEAVEGATNVYTFAKVPDDATHVIFNNGTVQTVDIPVVKGLNGFILQEEVNEGKHLAKTGEFNLGTKVIDEVTLVDFYAQVPADWEEVYIHLWEGAAGLKPAGWPGAKMTLVDAEKHIWKYTIDAKVATIIINAGADTETVDLPQTPNTLINVEGVNAVIVTAADSKDGAAAALAKYADGEITEVVVEKTTPVYYVVGDVKALSTTWNFADDGKLVINGDETESALTLALVAGDSFKVAVEGWSAEFGYFAELGAAFENDNGNIKVVTAGNYEFKVTDLNGTPALSITLKP